MVRASCSAGARGGRTRGRSVAVEGQSLLGPSEKAGSVRTVAHACRNADQRIRPVFLRGFMGTSDLGGWGTKLQLLQCVSRARACRAPGEATDLLGSLPLCRLRQEMRRFTSGSKCRRDSESFWEFAFPAAKAGSRRCSA